MEQLTNYYPTTLLGLITILALYECSFTGIYLIFKKSVRYHANRYLGGMLLVPATILLPGFFSQMSILDNLPHIVHLHLVTYFLFGPLAYFYVRSCIQKDFRMKPILWLHFLPLALTLIYFFPFYLQPGEEKIKAFIVWRETGSMGAPDWMMLIRMFHPVIYFFVCIRLVFLYRKHLDNNTSFIDTIFHRWLLYFSGILLLPVIGSILMFITNIITSYELGIAIFMFALMFLFAASIRFALHVKPSLFHVFPHQMLIPHSTEEKKQRYEKSTLQEDSKEQYLRKLISFMETEKPYLSSDLALSELSKQVKIPAHHLSQIINEKLECNFLDYINQYRIKEAQAMLINPKLDHYTVVSIAYEAGFNSKSTFYTAFKKNTKMTPSQYKRKQAKEAILN